MSKEKGPSRERIDAILNRTSEKSSESWLLESEPAKAWAGIISRSHGYKDDQMGEMIHYKSLVAEMNERGIKVPDFEELRKTIARVFNIEV